MRINLLAYPMHYIIIRREASCTGQGNEEELCWQTQLQWAVRGDYRRESEPDSVHAGMTHPHHYRRNPSLPLVLCDADALNIIADHPELLERQRRTYSDTASRRNVPADQKTGFLKF